MFKEPADLIDPMSLVPFPKVFWAGFVACSIPTFTLGSVDYRGTSASAPEIFARCSATPNRAQSCAGNADAGRFPEARLTDLS